MEPEFTQVHTPLHTDASVQKKVRNGGDFINSNVLAVMLQSCYQLEKQAHLLRIVINVLSLQLNKNMAAFDN